MVEIDTVPSGGGIRVTVLSGGSGGARLAQGLLAAVGAERLTVIVNTGDDFRPFGLNVSPDLDSVLYMLSGLIEEATGWGRAGDTGRVMAEIGALGGDTWFHLGDRDLAVHLLRTGWMAEGASLTEVTRRLCVALGCGATVIPATDDVVGTRVETRDGELDFQTWFVGQRCSPEAISVRYAGAAEARPSVSALEAVTGADLVVLGPSNPYLSICPVLAIPGFTEALTASRAPVVAVSPLIDGRAVKGPTATMLTRMAGSATNGALARIYEGVLDGLVIDTSDEHERGELENSGLGVLVTDTGIGDISERGRLAEEVLAFGAALRKAGRS